VAILWQRTIGGHHYQVRQAGRTRRLYTDTIFHTQYRPDRVLGGGYWDLLTLPALMLPAGKVKRVLLLGVGGGAAIHSLRALLQPVSITGVELNPVHVQIMKRWFGLGRGRTPLFTKGSDPFFLDLQIMDARDFIRAYKGEKFDLIIEDLYFERNGGAIRAVVMDEAWMKALRKCLQPQGMLVCNFADQRQFREASKLEFKWQNIFALTLPAYENCIGVFTRRRELMTDIPAALRKCAAMDKRIPKQAPAFQIKKVVCGR
jgi:predicted membrane-bound spermidine synthase